MNNEEMVQPIVVRTGGSHEETIAAAAIASVHAYFPTVDTATDPAAWTRWLSGRFTKTVRRAKPARYDRLAADAAARTDIGGAAACAWEPTSYANLPRDIARLQVSGTDFPRGGAPAAGPTGLHLTILNSLTTGKACAQAAHAAWLWLLDTDRDTVHAWCDRPTLSLTLVDDVAAAGHRWTVTDAGLTEVAPGTVTAAATYQ